MMRSSRGSSDGRMPECSLCCSLNRRFRRERPPISRIALMLGFQEVGAFSYAFRRWTGRKPTEARARRDRILNPPPPQQWRPCPVPRCSA
ncbi:protein of unknown function [Methylorubrum extorquens]|uniref:HTH araC/xylS-type domain-containing protein n=1 Tax=Methylorubrum extorquens TaxID=408 RepID=A0A2N9AXP6_METEX|nr:protein of unknown function [Methylorubrum extorquens]